MILIEHMELWEVRLLLRVLFNRVTEFLIWDWALAQGRHAPK